MTGLLRERGQSDKTSRVEPQQILILTGYTGESKPANDILRSSRKKQDTPKLWEKQLREFYPQSLSVNSITYGQQQSKTCPWKIPEINNSYIQNNLKIYFDIFYYQLLFLISYCV